MFDKRSEVPVPDEAGDSPVRDSHALNIPTQHSYLSPLSSSPLGSVTLATALLLFGNGDGASAQNVDRNMDNAPGPTPEEVFLADVKTVSEYLTDLDASRYNVREHAQEELTFHTPWSTEELKALLRSSVSDSLEVRARVSEILTEIEEGELPSTFIDFLESRTAKPRARELELSLVEPVVSKLALLYGRATFQTREEKLFVHFASPGKQADSFYRMYSAGFFEDPKKERSSEERALRAMRSISQLRSDADFFLKNLSRLEEAGIRIEIHDNELRKPTYYIQDFLILTASGIANSRDEEYQQTCNDLLQVLSITADRLSSSSDTETDPEAITKTVNSRARALNDVLGKFRECFSDRSDEEVVNFKKAFIHFAELCDLDREEGLLALFSKLSDTNEESFELGTQRMWVVYHSANLTLLPETRNAKATKPVLEDLKEAFETGSETRGIGYVSLLKRYDKAVREGLTLDDPYTSKLLNAIHVQTAAGRLHFIDLSRDVLDALTVTSAFMVEENSPAFPAELYDTFIRQLNSSSPENANNTHTTIELHKRVLTELSTLPIPCSDQSVQHFAAIAADAACGNHAQEQLNYLRSLLTEWSRDASEEKDLSQLRKRLQDFELVPFNQRLKN